MELVIARRELELFATGRHEHPQYIEKLLTLATGATAVNERRSASSSTRHPEKFHQPSFVVPVTDVVRTPVSESSYDPVPTPVSESLYDPVSTPLVNAVTRSHTAARADPCAYVPESGKSARLLIVVIFRLTVNKQLCDPSSRLRVRETVRCSGRD